MSMSACDGFRLNVLAAPVTSTANRRSLAIALIVSSSPSVTEFRHSRSHSDRRGRELLNVRCYTHDELVDAVNAEAATLLPETCRRGEFSLNDYLIEAMQLGIVELVDSEDALVSARVPQRPAGRRDSRTVRSELDGKPIR